MAARVSRGVVGFERVLLVMEKILTVNDVASILQVKAITVREMFRESRLRGFKVGKAWRTTQQMLQEDIDALMRGGSPVAERPEAQPAAAHADGNGAEKAARKKKPKEAASEAPKKRPRKQDAEVPASGNGSQHIEVREEAEVEDTQQLLF